MERLASFASLLAALDTTAIIRAFFLCMKGIKLRSSSDSPLLLSIKTMSSSPRIPMSPCKKFVEDDQQFNNFKRDVDYLEILEHISMLPYLLAV